MNTLVLFALAAIVSAVVATHDVSEDCWDTGCQLNTWAVKGCQNYGRYAKKQRPCPGGTIYTCCKKVTEGEVDGLTLMSPPKCNGVTKCLAKTSLPVDGCKAVPNEIVKNMEEEPCENDLVYSCCASSNADNAEHGQAEYENSRHSAEEFEEVIQE